jgi:hypothetical protein
MTAGEALIRVKAPDHPSCRAFSKRQLLRDAGGSCAQYVGLENQVRNFPRTSGARAVIEKNTWLLLICVTMLLAVVDVINPDPNNGETRIHRAVFAFYDLGLWAVWQGLIPMKESA